MSGDDRNFPQNPTQQAKAKGSVPRGGTPVVQSGPAQNVQTQPIQPPTGPRGVHMHELAQQLRPGAEKQARSPAEIEADMQRLAEGIKRHKAEEDPEQPPKEEKAADTEKETDDSDDLRSWLTSPSTEDLFNNTRYKKKIEKRLEKMDVESLIMHGEVVQFVPILMKVNSPQPRLSATFRSVSAMEDLAIKKRFYDEEGPDRFMIDRYSLMNLCIGLKSLNGAEQPPHLDENGKFDEAGFKKKFEKLLKMPHQLLALLVVNYIWFDERVRKLLVADELGNG